MRQEIAFEYLRELLGVDIQSQVRLKDSQVKGDGSTFATLATHERAIAVYYDITVELGSGDPGLQAALTYRKHIIQISVRDLCSSEAP
jgi:hypothetical protein